MPISVYARHKWQRLLALLSFLFCCCHGYAFTCTDSSGNTLGWAGGTVTIPVTVGPTLTSGKNVLANLSTAVSCHNDSSPDWAIGAFIDYLEATALELYPALSGVTGGVTINGTDYDSPIPTTNVYTLTWGQTRALPVQVYIRLSPSPSNPVIIHTGDMLAKISFHQWNDHGVNPANYAWIFVAANDAGIQTSSCTINGGNTLLVDFGEILSNRLTQTASTATIRVPKTLTYNCESAVTQDISIKMYSSVTSFSSDAILTSNQDIGVVMLRNGTAVAPNTSFQTSLTNGQGNDVVEFVPIKSSTSFSRITEGQFTASATLVMTVQ